jgi:2-(1,2-epoxy-1,2-dihydrophenyl)acetyl-CoA isomerase
VSEPGAKTSNDAAGAAAPNPLGTTVLHSIEGGISRITLNKPDAANAVSPDQRNLIIQLLADADADPAVRVVVIGAVGKYFCAGADLRGMASGMGGVRLTGSTMHSMLNGAQKLIAAVLDCGKPVIAAVQGPASGLGSHLAFACDLVVASEKADFSEPFVLRGITLDAAGAYLLPRRVGLQKAKEMVFLGERLPAAEAKTLGLVNTVCSPAEFDAAVDALATRLAGAATTGILLAKRLLNASLDSDRANAFLAEAMAQEVVTRTDDAKEGVASFLEKRPSNFKGH